MLIEIIKTIMKGKHQEPEQNILSVETAELSFFFSFNRISPSSTKLSMRPRPRDLWKLQLIDSLLYLHIEVPVSQDWNERTRSSMPIYPFSPGIVFRLALRLIVSSQEQNTNTLSVLRATRTFCLKFMVIPRLATVANTKQMGIVWQILPFHLSLNENKTRQLLITNNREMSQGESYPIKTSPVNLGG